MTSDATDDVLHFRGETLTPESPRPIHISEPSNIPVLENQIDPVFNDTSTYQNVPAIREEWLPNTLSEVEDPIHLTKQMFSRTLELFRTGNATLGSTAAGDDDGQKPGPEEEPTPAPPAGVSAPTTNQYGSSVGDSGSSHQLSRDDVPSLQSNSNPFLSHPSSSDIVSTSSRMLPPQAAQQEPSAMSTVSASPNPQDPRDQSFTSPKDGGAGRQSDGEVNFQSLLDNLLQPAITTPTASSNPNPADVPAENASAMLPIEMSSSSYSSNLPPRPLLEGQPPLQPGYSPADDMRSLHAMLSQASSGVPQHTQSHLNPSFSSAESTSGAEAPLGTTPLSAGPPPPHPTSPLPHQSHSKPSDIRTTHIRHPSYERAGESGSKATPERDDDDAPWGPDVQRKYDEFLREERAYVTEGLWDRFPPGSRLFVGKHQYTTSYGQFPKLITLAVQGIFPLRG
jgi:hypothetical protein